MRRYACILLAVAAFICGRLSHELPVSAQECDNEPPRCQDVNGDDAADIADAVCLLSWLFGGGPEPECPCSCPPPAGLPDTGQTTCYDETGEEIPCDSATCPGQDGFCDTGCPIEDRFIENGNGTVTDTCTGLMWQQDTGNGGIALNWLDALTYCDGLSFAGHDDWRLPNVRELQSIVDYGRVSPATDPVFGMSMSFFYWSSTSYAGFPALAWSVFYGNVDTDGKGVGGYVRAVRTVQPGE